MRDKVFKVFFSYPAPWVMVCLFGFFTFVLSIPQLDARAAKVKIEVGELMYCSKVTTDEKEKSDDKGRIAYRCFK